MGDYNYYGEHRENNGEENYNGQPNYNQYNPYQKQPKQPRQKKPKNPNSFGHKLLKVAAIALVFGLIGGCAFTGSAYLLDGVLGGKEAEQIEDATENSASLTTASGSIGTTSTSSATTVTDVSDIVDNVMPAIVQVTAVSVEEYQSFFGRAMSYESTSAGSGIIVSQDDTYVYVVTNNHVVSGAESLTITFCDDSAVAAEIQGTASDTDLAVVKVAIADMDSSTLSSIKVATLGSSDDLTVGSSAIVIGNALGYGQSVTTGVISALDREVELEGDDGQTITNTLIQTDAAVNPGNSGGALLNMNGEVVGIVSAKYSDTTVEGMGYAIPISDAIDVIEDLMAGGDGTDTTNSAKGSTNTSGNTAALGISGIDISANSSSGYNVPSGAYVLYVQSGSAADEAGIERYDIITGFNNVQVSSYQEIQNLMSSFAPGDQVKVEVCTSASNYEDTVTYTVTLGEAQ